MNILIVEDESALAEALEHILRKAGHNTDWVADGQSALDYIRGFSYDLILLDVMLPKLDGLAVARQIRAEHIDTPVLMLTARTTVPDKVAGLNAGADDYLTKPFDLRELLARLRVMTRKQELQQTNQLRIGNTRLDTASHTLSGPEGCYKLANKEYQTILLLMRNPGALLSPGRFLENIWDPDSRAEDNTVWTYISYLRRKLEAIGSDLRITTRRNAGYVLERQE